MTPQDPRAHANLLLIEIGNSHVALATVINGKLAEPQRHDAGDANIVPAALAAWNGLPGTRIKEAVLASVVPIETARLMPLLTTALGKPPQVIGVDIALPLELAVASPESVGIDRICGCAAAQEQIKEACAVASFGTATTIDCVDADGRFRGGAILPGLATQAWSLHMRTAQLPEVTIAAPPETYGQDTASAILNGIVYGAIGAMREIVERYSTDLRRWPKLVITGGHAALIREHCDFVDVIVPDLVLRGMLAAQRKQYLDGE